MFKLSRSFEPILRSPCWKKQTRPCTTSFEKVKIISTGDDAFIRISFKYGKLLNSNNMLSLKVSKDEIVSEVLSRIRLMATLQRKKEELRRVVASRYSDQTEVCEIDDEIIDVSLIHENKHVEKDAKNIDAWAAGCVLKIGDLTYQIDYNAPAVIQLSLPEYIVSGCVIRPRFSFECAVLEDSEFVWYRSTCKSSGICEDTDSCEWTKVGEGFRYTTSQSDTGHKLKLLCIPKCGEISGEPLSAESTNAVEAAPSSFPFEERHKFTKELVDSDCIRCVSYNVLANIYVDRKKYPYSSRKARDPYYRKQLTEKEILGYNSDITCLQEVQERMFYFDLMPSLERVGFHGFYNRKGGRRYEGLAVFYRSEKFKPIHQEGVFLNDVITERKEIFNELLGKVSGNYKSISKLLAQDTTLQLVLLEHVDRPNHRVLVANTHLYSNKDAPEVRLLQAAICARYMEYLVKEEKKSENTGFVFCGDFNSLPGSATYKFLVKGSIELSPYWQNNNSAAVSSDSIQHDLSFSSACGTPYYTNYTADFSGCLDYIFYSNNMFKMHDVVPMPHHDVVTRQIALPNDFFPSDHIALVCTLKWRNWNNNS